MAGDTNGSRSEHDVAGQVDRMSETLAEHIRAAEARLVRELDAIGKRVVALESFRDTFVDDDGNKIAGKTILRRLVALEQTNSTIKALVAMGKGALALGKVQILLAGFLLLIAVKGTWEGIEWMLGKLGI